MYCTCPTLRTFYALYFFNTSAVLLLHPCVFMYFFLLYFCVLYIILLYFCTLLRFYILYFCCNSVHSYVFYFRYTSVILLPVYFPAPLSRFILVGTFAVLLCPFYYSFNHYVFFLYFLSSFCLPLTNPLFLRIILITI